jgi:uncharacterized membrane protein
MKRKFRALPAFIRWLLVTLVILGIAGGGTYAYVALTSTSTVQVNEALSFVGDHQFTLNIYPQDSTSYTITVANASTHDMEVNLLSSINPDPTGKGITITIPNKITAPASGQVSFNVQIAASKSVVPGSYSIAISLDR